MGDGDSGMGDMGDVGSVSVTGSIGNGADAFGGDGYGDMPDIGTLGGTFADTWGENSATLGGINTNMQDLANSEAFPEYAKYSPWGKAQQVIINGAINKGLSSLFGPAAPLASAGINAFKAPEGKKSGAFMGSLMDSTLAAPFALVANLMGLQTPGKGVAAHGGYSGPDGQSNSFGAGANTGSNEGWGNTLGGLASLYSMYSRNRENDRFTSSLANMYGPNSPYAKQLEQSLARRDAAGGRRSQYGPREVELQAKLAQAQAGIGKDVMAGKQQGLTNMMQMMQQMSALQKMGAFDKLGSMFAPQWNNYEQTVQDWSPSTPITDVGWDG